jgi:hypothetical protein
MSLQKPLSYLLILLTLCSGFTKFYFYVGYELNKTYISTTLCENRDKSQLDCKGKCFLKKKISQAEKQEQKQERSGSKSFFNDHFLISQYRFRSIIRQTDVYVPSPAPSYDFLNSQAVFHPPQV